MDYWRRAALGLILGIVLIPLGYFITPPGMTLAQCAASLKFILEGIYWFYIVWSDGCNTHHFALPTVLGGVSIAVGSGYGAVATGRRMR